jgi:uncharacterized protein YlxW (UPF0749 family)
LNVLIPLLALVIGVVAALLASKYFFTDAKNSAANNQNNQLDQLKKDTSSLKEDKLNLKNRVEQYAITAASSNEKIEGLIARNAILEAENGDLKTREVELKNSIKTYANSLISKTMKTLTGDKNVELESSVDPKQREH